MRAFTPRERELLLEALERQYQHTLALKRSAGVRGYSTREKHQETLREVRVLYELVSGS